MNRNRTNADVAFPLTHGGTTCEADVNRGNILEGLPLPFLAIVVAHIPLALAARSKPVIMTVVAVAILVFGCVSAIRDRQGSGTPYLCAAYFAGSEVFLRSVGALDPLLYEFPKYAVILIIGAAILRRPEKVPQIPVLFLALLVPSSLIWLGEAGGMEFSTARMRLSGNLAGPVALGVCAVYFSRTALSVRDRIRIVLIVAAGATATATLVLTSTATHQAQLHFGKTANFLASGGAGPNQVSNALALAASLAWLLLLSSRLGQRVRIMLMILIVGLSVPMLLTFSRGGAFTTGLVVVSSLLVGFLTGRTKFRLLAISFVVLLVLLTVVWPWLEDFTGGAAGRRFSNLESARWTLAASEFQLFLDHPLLGVGPGRAREEVAQYLGYKLRAHVEFTRLLAEHGAFGFLALVALFAGFASRYKAARSQDARVWIVGAMVFSCAYWMQSATRTVAPSFTYGLVWANFIGNAVASRARFWTDGRILRDDK